MAKTVAALERGRRSYARREWAQAYESLAAADELEPLGPDDLELLATAAYMLGREDESLGLVERAHHGYLEHEVHGFAIRTAFWIGINLAYAGEVGRATGWLGRGQRLLETQDDELAEGGYALLPAMFRHAAAGELDAAAEAAGAAVEVAQRFGERNLLALALMGQGQMLIKARRVDDGLALLDEAMVAATSEELSPIVTGLVYCGVILACRDVHELRRAQEWTGALSRWCEQQSDLVAFTGRCLVHRAEVMQVGGEWEEALAEARRAGERLVATANHPAAALAFYRQGELLRLQGRYEDAEEAYRTASRHGREPQPGLALLRLAQGRRHDAATAIRRILGESTEPLERAGLLPAAVEILLAVGDADGAETACRELEEIAESFESGMLGALLAQAKGAVALARGKAQEALVELRGAWREWQELEAPYEVARVRVLVGRACSALGDGDSAALELEAARETFARLGALPDLASLERGGGRQQDARYGLTGRELEVLRLVAAGRSNRAIAAELTISEHTVARHVQNIFAKLRLSSRAAATAFAFEHDLV